jgi:hypothetical protein
MNKSLFLGLVLVMGILVISGFVGALTLGSYYVEDPSRCPNSCDGRLSVGVHKACGVDGCSYCGGQTVCCNNAAGIYCGNQLCSHGCSDASWSGWSPNPSTVCEGVEFTQTRTCSGGYVCNTPNNPDGCGSTTCSGSSTRVNTGTKYCCVPEWEIIEPKNYTCSDGTRSMILKNDTNCGTGVQFFEYENCFPNQCVEETGRCSTLDTTYWANLRTGQEIQNLSLGGTALMVVGGQGLGDMSINFTIQKEGGGLLVGFLSFFGVPKPWLTLTEFIDGNRAQLTSPLNESGDFRFKANVEGTSVERESEILEVSSDVLNFKPIANITSPEKRESPYVFSSFSVDEEIEFAQASYDEDDLLKLTWNFGDGNNRTLYNYSRALNSSGGDTIYRYNGSNTEVGGKFYTVTLTAEEMTRTQVSEPDSVQIYVFKKGVNVVPIITSPRLREGGYFLHFNASQSYVVNCSEGSEGEMGSVEGIQVGNFNCPYLLAPGKTDLEPGVPGEVRIRWSEVDNFVDRSVITNGWFTKNEQAGVVWNSTNYNSSVTFSVLDPRPTLRKIVMEMNYNATAA